MGILLKLQDDRVAAALAAQTNSDAAALGRPANLPLEVPAIRNSA